MTTAVLHRQYEDSAGEVVAAIDLWRRRSSKVNSRTPSGVRKHTRFPGGFLWRCGNPWRDKAFPEKYLVRLPQTLAEFVRSDDHSYRNDNRHED